MNMHFLLDILGMLDMFYLICYASNIILKFCIYTGEKGFEPLTFGFGDHYSTIETIPL